jgi:hypothetical protein
MRFIDKSKNVAAGNVIINQLLDDCWNSDELTYRFANYEDLSKNKYRGRIVPLILDEQNNLCCYCMCELNNENTTTLEHIIPQKLKLDTKLAEYNDYLNCKTISEYVIHRDYFDLNTKIIPPGKYPHDIAYNNLIASCDSEAHCNNFRGSKNIKPFIFDNQIEDKVRYDEAGRVDCDEYADDLANVGLSTNKLLQLIRRIWQRLSLSIANIKEFSEDDIEDEIILLVDDPDYDRIIEDFFDKPSKKAELLKYKWFYYYYKNN